MDIEVLAVTAWSLWNNRNAVQHEDPGKQAATTVTEASRHMEEYCFAQAPSPPGQYIIPPPGAFLHRISSKSTPMELY
nr:hypothetical protein CFP56_14480 [Quercus suber]